MANKLKWFTHDHDAHEDGWIRNLVRKQGHVAGWLWWVLLETYHKHGVGDILKRDINDIAKAGLTSASVLTRVLTEMGTEYEGQQKVRWTLVGTELELEIPKLRKRLANLKSKVTSKSPEHHFKTTQEGEVERERDVQPLYDPKLGMIKPKEKLPNGDEDTAYNRSELGNKKLPPLNAPDFKRLGFDIQKELNERWKEKANRDPIWDKKL